MSSSNFKNPPKLENNDSFDNWEKAIKLWRLVTDIPKEKQGAAIALSCRGKAYDAVLELTEAEITAQDGVDKILAKLGTIYKKDEVDSAYDAFEKFINFKRGTEMSINSYITEFEKLYAKAKKNGFDLSNGL